MCKFVLDCDPDVVYHPEKSNQNLAKLDSAKLYTKLRKNNYLEKFNNKK